MSSILLQTMLSLLVAIIVASMSYKFALSAFYRQRWWETRRDNYLQLLDALHTHHREAEVRWLKEIHSHEYDEVFLAKLEQNAGEARATIHRCAALADFLFSSEASDRIGKYLLECQKFTDDYNTSFHDVMNFYMDADQKLMSDIKIMAQRDLGIRGAAWLTFRGLKPTIGVGFGPNDRR